MAYRLCALPYSGLSSTFYKVPFSRNFSTHQVQKHNKEQMEFHNQYTQYRIFFYPKSHRTSFPSQRECNPDLL